MLIRGFRGFRDHPSQLFADLFDALVGRVDPLVGVVEDEVDRLVEALQRPDEVPPVRRDDRHHPIHVALQRRGHANCALLENGDKMMTS